MKCVNLLVISLVSTIFSLEVIAQEVKTLRFGTTEVSVGYETTKYGSTIFTMIAQLPETNDLRRGLKNTDQRRLSKLGQLVYQCKLLVPSADMDSSSLTANNPALTARNFSLYTGVDLLIGEAQQVGIQAKSLQVPGANSLFNVRLDKVVPQQTRWETVGEGNALNLKQFDLGSVIESDLIESSESVEITARFPIFQMEEPANEWRYHFDLVEFKKAVGYIDENCKASAFSDLLGRES